MKHHGQLHLFESNEPKDNFMSGTPDRPDPYDPEYVYWNGKGKSPFGYEALSFRDRNIDIVSQLGKLVLCEPVEDGWEFDNVIELFPDQAA